MGHDVIAFRYSHEELNQMAIREITERLESGDLGSFEEFQNELARKAVVVTMRRSSFDRYNKVIYTLCKAEATYGGFSGNQGSFMIDREDVDHALAVVEHWREAGIPALTDEEIEGLKERLVDASTHDYDTGVNLIVHTVNTKTGEKTELTGAERREHIERLHQENGGEFGSTCEDNLETEYRFLTEIKTCMDQEGLEKIRVWFG